MAILAIDPGNEQSAYVLMRPDLSVIAKGIVKNEELLQLIPSHPNDTELAIEMVASYGMAVGETTFETVFWIGRFYEAARKFRRRARIKRMDVKMHICSNSRAKDANIRQALIDRFAKHDKKRGTGTKANTDWFYGFKADIWQAYAVGVTYGDAYEIQSP